MKEFSLSQKLYLFGIVGNFVVAWIASVISAFIRYRYVEPDIWPFLLYLILTGSYFLLWRKWILKHEVDAERTSFLTRNRSLIINGLTVIFFLALLFLSASPFSIGFFRSLALLPTTLAGFDL